MSRGLSSGFSLIELMIALAISGVLLAMAAGGWGALSRRAEYRNAAIELQAALQDAHTRAVQSSGAVWVVLYPELGRTVASGGRGAYFVVEDPKLEFAGAATYGYSTFSPPSAVLPTAGSCLLNAAVYLEDYRGQGLSFVTGSPGAAYPAPFSSLLEQGCSFCSGTPRRGALVFTADGPARFVDGAGAAVSAREAGFALKSLDPPIRYLFGVSAPTSFIGVYAR